MTKSNEPVWWSLFALGGGVAAMLMPVTILVTGFLVPMGVVSEEGLVALISHPLGRLYLFVLISLPLFHGAHRLLFTLVDLGLKPIRPFLAVLFYGGAIAGTILSAVLLIRL